MSAREVKDTFACFGSSCSVLVTGDASAASAAEAVARARHTLLGWHGSFSRFEPDSELSRLNRDPRTTVPVSVPMALLADAVRGAGELSGGLVDGTLVGEIEAAGYRADLGAATDLGAALARAPQRTPAGAGGAARWREIGVDFDGATVTRPLGVMLDSGGLAKGLFADILAESLSGHDAFAVSCAGDLAIGGRAGVARAIRVESPFDGAVLHTFDARAGAAATSGIGRRSWREETGAPAHDLLDPRTGRPAFTGVVQASALASSALLAEIRAKAAILSGPAAAPRWLPDGGVFVFDDGSHEVVAAPPRVLAPRARVMPYSPPR